MVEKPDPWPPAQEALFNMVRAWVKEDDQDKVARECLRIMEEVNETEGAPFIFVAELARMLAICVTRYMLLMHEKVPERDEIMAEIDALELEYVEEFVLAEMEDDDGETTNLRTIRFGD